MYVFNSVVNAKLPAILSHQRSTTVSLETYPFYSCIVTYFGISKPMHLCITTEDEL